MIYSKRIFNKEPNLLMRLGDTKTIKKEYNSGIITFSCAANWIDYAVNKNNIVIGDTCEGVFAHIPYPISNYYEERLVDKKGKPLGNNLLVTTIGNGKYCYLRYIPTILMPTICFYAFDCEKLLRKENRAYAYIPFDIYAFLMHKEIPDSSMLVIKDIQRFEDDLKSGIVDVVTMSGVLSNAGFVNKFDYINPYLAAGIDYGKYDYSSEFFENTCNAQALFVKQKEYKQQSEFRFVINNIRFRQIYPKYNYDYRTNQLKVKLLHLQEYSELVSLVEWCGLYLEAIDSEQFFICKYRK